MLGGGIIGDALHAVNGAVATALTKARSLVSRQGSGAAVAAPPGAQHPSQPTMILYGYYDSTRHASLDAPSAPAGEMQENPEYIMPEMTASTEAIVPEMAAREEAVQEMAAREEVMPEGSEAMPEGGEAMPEGSEAMPEGSEAMPEGSEAMPFSPEEIRESRVPEGSEAMPEGSEAMPEGSEAMPFSEEEIRESRLPEGSEAMPFSEEELRESRLPEGSEAMPEGGEAMPTPEGGETMPFSAEDPREARVPQSAAELPTRSHDMMWKPVLYSGYKKRLDRLASDAREDSVRSEAAALGREVRGYEDAQSSDHVFDVADRVQALENRASFPAGKQGGVRRRTRPSIGPATSGEPEAEWSPGLYGAFKAKLERLASAAGDARVQGDARGMLDEIAGFDAARSGAQVASVGRRVQDLASRDEALRIGRNQALDARLA
jgi:hypothetical protein